MQFQDQSCALHLGGMLRFATVSHPDADQIDFSEFRALHQYLEETYPLVHKTLQREIIGRAALLYTWHGTGKGNKLPLLFAAHQDVVPAGDPDQWRFPPFSGVIEDGRLWGRGACDCKGNIMAHMEALEALIAEGFQPDCDIYLAYGWNEEVNGGDENAAAALCAALRERGVRLGMVIDEGRGPGLDPMEGVEESVAYVFTCEKGYADIRISIKDRGGHSMMPGSRSIIAELGQIAVDLMANQYPYRAVDAIVQEYSAKAHAMGERGKAFARIATDGLDAVTPLLDQMPALACKFRTTMALTMIQGSKQANILPTEASMVMNCRLLPGDTLDGLMEKVRGIVAGRAEVTLLKGGEASAESRTDSVGYQCIREVTEEMFPGTLVLPSIMTGGTDAKNYYPICDSVYRYSGFPSVEDPCAHNFNEHLRVEGLGKGPEFIYRLIRRYMSAG